MRGVLWICLALAQAAAQIQPAPAPAAGTGSIEGIVTGGAGHEPLKKAQVTLSGTFSALPNGRPASPLTVATDASGAFAFRALPAGTYWLNASKPGYNVPQDVLGTGSNVSVRLGDGEQRKDVSIELAPGGTISGHVLNQDSFPVRSCTVAAVQQLYEQGRPVLRQTSGADTDDKGEYRLANLARGRYYVFAHCHVSLPAAHPLLPRDDPRTPHETYLPQLYGGGLDPASATQVRVASGANLGGVDFRLTRVAAFTLHGTLTASDPGALAGHVNVMLLPANPLLRNLMVTGSGVDPAGATFEIHSVIPGAYRLFAFRRDGDRMVAGERAVQVGNVPPDPVEISLSAGLDLKGALQFDSDDRPPLENCQVSLVPLAGSFFIPQPTSHVDKDGAFTLPGVQPGLWRLSVSALGYPKSVSLGGQQVSPYGFQIVPGAGPLQIVMETKMADVRVTVEGSGASGQVYAVIFPEDLTHLGMGLERVSSGGGGDQLRFGALAPGRYRVFATDVQNPWTILQRPDLLKALEDRSTALDLSEDEPAAVTVELIPRDELARVLGDAE